MSFNTRKQYELEVLRRLAGRLENCKSMSEINECFVSFVSWHSGKETDWIAHHIAAALASYVKEEVINE